MNQFDRLHNMKTFFYELSEYVFIKAYSDDSGNKAFKYLFTEMRSLRKSAKVWQIYNNHSNRLP